MTSVGDQIERIKGDGVASAVSISDVTFNIQQKVMSRSYRQLIVT